MGDMITQQETIYNPFLQISKKYFHTNFYFPQKNAKSSKNPLLISCEFDNFSPKNWIKIKISLSAQVVAAFFKLW